MLERASTCLETGGRQLLRAPKPCLRNRRALHASFWHHGASDLVPPVACVSSPSRTNGDLDDRHPYTTVTVSRDHHGPLFLDFLYPEKTLAFIRRLSAYSSEWSGRRRRHTPGSGVRQFSTSRWQPSDNEVAEDAHDYEDVKFVEDLEVADRSETIDDLPPFDHLNSADEVRKNLEGDIDAIDDLETLKAKEQMEEMLLRTTADDAMKDILSLKKPGNQELAWHMYSAISETARTPQIQVHLIEYLAELDMKRVANRILQLFDDIPAHNRLASSYRFAISAHVALKLVGPAIQLHEEAATRFNTIYIGTDAILKRTIQDDQWDLSFRVFRTFLQQATRLRFLKFERWNHRRHDKQFAAIWGQVAQLPDLVERWHSFLAHVHQFEHELNSTEQNKQALDQFVKGFAPEVMNQVIHEPMPNEEFIWKFTLDLFHELRSLNLPTSDLYEHTISTMIDTPRYREYTNQWKIFLELYQLYRKQCIDNSEEPPSRYLLTRLLVHHGEKESLNRVQAVVNDLQTFYPDKSFTPESLAYLIRFHAKNGNVDRVHEYFDIYRTTIKKPVDLRLVTSLVYAYARRIDIRGAVEQFKRIQGEFGLVPDAACWNTLLLAYTRADDLDGALGCFNKCLESGISPDVYTFGPMLDLCAARGDVEAFEALYARAQHLQVPVHNDLRARAGYVQAFLNTEDPDGAEAIAHGMLHSWRAGTLRGESLTHTWNIMIAYYAVRSDLTNSRRMYRQMIDNKIPMDTWTYGGLMRALIQAHQTNAAYKILRTTMPQNNIRVYAFHYAIVITGFLRERQYRSAQQAYKRMQQRRLPQTKGSRQASLLVVGIQELRKLREERVKDPKARLVAVEEQLRTALLANYGTELASNQPSHERFIDSKELSHVPQGYFALVIMLYTTHGALDICKQLFAAASKTKSGETRMEAPITLLTAIMETHLKAKEYAEVERCWLLAHSEADRLVKTFHQIKHPDSPTPESGLITEPIVQARFESSRIATNRRQILFRASRVYIRSLLAQEGSRPLQQAQRTVRDLLTQGLIIDSLTWNELIQHLALRGRTIDAFSACEMYLMPSFPGWQSLSPVYERRDMPGHSWMELRSHDIKRDSVLPRYKTMVVLAAAYAQVKRDEVNGLGFNTKLGKWTGEILEKISPLTIRAVETMPRTGDALQLQYLQQY